jgi:hypothetical protein
MRKLKFDLDIAANALLCPNPDEFYSKAYITENVADNFRVLPGIKSATKLANVVFDNLIKASNCNFSAGDDTLDAVDIDVCAVSAMAEICQFDLESSFVSKQMVKGSNGNFEVASFMNYYWTELASEIEAEVEQIRWQGNTSLTGTTFLKECDGYEKKLDAQVTGSTKVATSALTSSNIISVLTSLTSLLPAGLNNKKKDVRIYMNGKTALLYTFATLGLNQNFNYTGELDLQFAGFKIAVQEGMSDNHIAISSKNNFVYAFDGEGDGKALKAINLADTVAEPKIRTRANLKMGFHILNPTEIVWFG